MGKWDPNFLPLSPELKNLAGDVTPPALLKQHIFKGKDVGFMDPSDIFQFDKIPNEEVTGYIEVNESPCRLIMNLLGANTLNLADLLDKTVSGEVVQQKHPSDSRHDLVFRRYRFKPNADLELRENESRRDGQKEYCRLFHGTSLYGLYMMLFHGGIRGSKDGDEFGDSSTPDYKSKDQTR